ncbi:MAG: cupredoxin domain-containing protein [Candidatus Andersenbacteria bacterium]|nr:cupredoxin domain-containing protein [Candidatus Andersenbacteria bacterium]MBI3250946.1 cupredoxin domain-containing protein [Candidatus Andersenbacteria bacterium]
MKTGTITAVVGVVIIVAVASMFAFRTPAEAPAVTPTPGFQDATAPASDSGQFIQLQPSTTPNTSLLPSVSPAAGTTQQNTTTAESIAISIDDTGFTPRTVSIASGTTVVFTNNGQAKHWPASDVHPTHQALPGFDAKHGLETGETYSFTFIKTGSWNMHDHLNPSATGIITVQ